MSIILRKYQKDAINLIKINFAKGLKRLILCSPTGSGKTVMFSEIARQVFTKNKKVLIITNRKELLKQTGNTLNNFDLKPFFLTANTKEIPSNSIGVAMVETMKRRLLKQDYIIFIQSFYLIIIDECHICSFDRIFDNIKENQYIIGATATPIRTGKMKPLKNYYDKIIEVCTIDYLVKNNFLAFPVSYGVPMDLTSLNIKAGEFDERDMQKFYSNDKIYSGLIENIKKHTLNEKILIFSPTIETSELIVNELIENNFNAKHFDCYMNDINRNNILNWFNNTDNAILSNVGILTTGFDCPSINSVVIYRATKSLALFLQMIGRGSRIFNNKNSFKIFDFGNNIARFGYWENERVWSLETDLTPIKKEKKVAPVKNCPQCDALIFASVKTCKFCCYIYPTKESEKTRIFTILEKLTPSEIQRFASDCNVKELEEIRKIKGYKLGWICHKLNTLIEFSEYEKLRGFKKGWAQYNYKKFKL